MKIKFLKEDSLDILKKEDIEKNKNNYSGDNSWLVLKYINKGTDLFGVFNKKEFKDFSLIMDENGKFDFENMKIVYDTFKDITDSQASDERLWSGLAHTCCWEYMQKRWPLPIDKDKQVAHILNNYFFWNSTKGVFLNGISRLWWYARYTYDERFDDPYILTKYICENDINGKIFPLLACRFAMNPEIFKNIILSIKSYEESKEIKLTRDEFNLLKKYLNRLSGKIVIDSLSYEEIDKKIVNKIDVIIKNRV